jgi:adenylate cyclase class IV
MNITKSASSSAEIVIQGKSKTRESLLTFKKNLEQDKMFYDIEMPISDLAKTIDSTYAIKFKLKKQNANKL